MALNHFDDWFNLVQADQGVKGNAGAEQSGWWVTEVRRRGAFATLCGVSIDVLAMRWKAISVGDTCVFHVRGDDLLGAFPIDDPTKFDSTPDLLGSNVDPPLPWHARGDLLPRDVLLVASDALAAWALTESSNRPGIWSFLASLRSDQFRVFIEDARSKGGLENDDVTLIRCEVRDG